MTVRLRLRVSVAVVAVVLLLPPGARAQSSPPEPPANAEFFLGRPHGSLAVKAGWLFASTGSDLYDFVTKELTLSRKAFDTPVIGGEMSFAVGNRFDVLAGVDVGRSSSDSEYRNFVDNRNAAIAQTTARREVGLSGSVRMALVPRGRRVSRFAWIPRTVTPYVGAGGGAVKFEFTQTGSFVDFATSRVFDDTFTADGWAPSAHVLAGADVRVYRRLYLSFESRYTWSHGTLGRDFVGFAPLALAGLRVNSGLQLVF